METKEVTLFLGVSGYKAVAVVAVAVLGVYASKKILDKLCDASVAFNVDGKSNEGK